MSSYLDAIDLVLPAKTSAGEVRQQVLSELSWAPTPASMVSYVSSNRVLIIASESLAMKIQAQLPDKMQTYLALIAAESSVSKVTNAWNTGEIQLQGYLGRFEAFLNSQDIQAGDEQDNNLGLLFNIANGLFDQVIDCSDDALITATIKPPGYYHFNEGADDLEDVLTQVTQLIGEFEKPRYFNYETDICAHGSSGIKGCTRCLQACPTQAIISIGNSVQVNPYLCQGGGSCASSCPTGAMSYTYPKVEEQIEFLRLLLKGIRDKNANLGISLLIYDNEHAMDAVAKLVADLPEHLIPFMVEDIGSVGLDLLGSALAYGANQIFIYVPDSVPDQVSRVISENVGLLQFILNALDLKQFKIESLAKLDLLIDLAAPKHCLERVAKFSAVGSKRNTIRASMTHLNTMADEPSASIALPQGSLFGQITVNADACTLCMACVSVCPAKALQDGGDTPALKFIEANCVQCTICSSACPENAIKLNARIHFDHDHTHSSRTLNEEQPFHCLRCGKAFATQSMIKNMTAKLKDHWMFDKPEGLNRLKMCEDCRVADMFENGDIQA